MFAPAQSLPAADRPVVIYLSTNNVVPARYGQAARAMAEMYLHSLGGAPSRGALTAPPANDQQRQQRAVFLLWEAIEWAVHGMEPFPFANSGAVPMMNIAIRFEFTIYKALMVYDARNNANFAAKHVLETIFAGDGLRFLTHNRVIIRGSVVRVNGPGNQNVLPFNFSYDPFDDRFIIDSGVAVPGSYQFLASSIVATHWTAVPGRGNNIGAGSFAGIQAIEVAGAPIVVTTQFTGCSLCYRLSGGSLYAAHINPGSGQLPPAIGSGTILAEQLCGQTIGVAAADFANAAGPAMSIYGRGLSNLNAFPNGYGGPALEYFTMIGFNHGGWHMFAQENNLGGGITNVRQIYP